MADTKAMIVRGIGDDGLWKEGTIGYQLFARHALVACLEPLARRGHDLYGYAGCRVKNLWDSPLKFAYPDGTAPGINDSGRSPVAGSWQAMAYDYAYLRYQDPNYGKLVNEAPRQVFQSEGCYFPTAVYETLPEREIKALGSVIFDTLGYAILRGVEDGKETFLLMDYGPHGGGHGHPDKLNLILFADGDELAGEPKAYRYEDGRHRDWTRPSIAHWTLSVDMHEQAPTTGKLLAFYDAGPVKVMLGPSSRCPATSPTSSAPGAMPTTHTTTRSASAARSTRWRAFPRTRSSRWGHRRPGDTSTSAFSHPARSRRTGPAPGAVRRCRQVRTPRPASSDAAIRPTR
jgi:hypothetical protein